MRSQTGAPLGGNAWRALLPRPDDGTERGVPLWLGILLSAVLFAGLLLIVFLLIPK